MNKPLKFVQSVLPADPAQLIFIAGVVCLIVAPHLRWLPDPNAHAPSLEFYFPTAAEQQARIEWYSFFAVASLPIFLAYASGVLVCFFPGKRPIQRVSLSVLLPAVGGFGWICQHFVSLQTTGVSTLLHGSARFGESFDLARTTLWTLGPGFRVCLLGIILILVFISRLALKSSSLPITLADRSISTGDVGLWKRTKLLIWFVLGLGSLVVGAFLGILTITFQTVFKHLTGREIFIWPYGSFNIALSCAVIGIVIWISGRAGRQAIRSAVPLRQLGYLVLAVIFALGIDSIVSAGQYLFDYIYWGAHFYARITPPHFDTYFNVPPHSFQFLSGIAIAALAEEITFRGILQPWLISRYEIWCGLVFVNLAWSVTHFYRDFNLQMTEMDAVLALSQRVFLCLALGFVFGWLTLRTKSIWPAVISHASFNVVAFSQSGYQFTGRATVRAALWAILAYLLFRYWPVQLDTTVGSSEGSAPGSIETASA